MSVMTREETEALIQEVLEVYPEKPVKDRAKHLAVNDHEVEQSKKCITSNKKSLPGVMTIRGCAYAGSKGVVWGPIKDMIHISHGPVGCGQYSRAGRRNYYVGTTGVNTFGTMNFTSDFQEKDIVFGGDKKLAKLIDEVKTLFPLNKGISVQSECPIGLIGDDIEAVSKKKARSSASRSCRCAARVSAAFLSRWATTSPMTRFATMCWSTDEDRETSQSATRNRLTTSRSSATTTSAATPGLRAPCSRKWVCAWSPSGPATGRSPSSRTPPSVKLNLLHCYRSMNYISRHMEEKYGIPWIEYNFFGPTKIAESLRADRRAFRRTIKEGAERVIEKYRPGIRGGDRQVSSPASRASG